jgi:putative transposase
MARRKRAVEPLATIWNCPDELWDKFVLPTLHERDPEPHTGRPRINQRKALDGIIYQMRSGCQWNHLPREFGDDASIHRTLQRWIACGVLERLWAKLVEACDELGAVQWVWQSADAALGKARFGGIVSAKTPPIAANRARNTACWSKPKAGHWLLTSRPPTFMTA